MEYLKISNEQYDTLENIRKFGLFNFMSIGTENYEKIRALEYDYKTIDDYDEEKGYIVKPLSELVLANAQYNENLYYWVQLPKKEQQNLENKLIVLFLPFAGTLNVEAGLRIWANGWDKLIDRVANNTYILRIGDSSLVSGSWYQNTELFPDYEERIQAVIAKTARDYGIIRENIILYGESRGGTGALLHGLLGNYTVVAHDPVLDLRSFHKTAWIDRGLIYDFIPETFIPRLNDLLFERRPEDAAKIKIVTSDNINLTYPAITQLMLDKIEVFNLDFRMPLQMSDNNAHGAFLINNYPLVLSLLNEFLYRCDSSITKHAMSWRFDDWDVMTPLTCEGFMFHYRDTGFLVRRSSCDTEEGLNFPFRAVLAKDKKYRLTLLVDNPLNLKRIFIGDGEGRFQALTEVEREEQYCRYVFITTDYWTHLIVPSTLYNGDWQLLIKNIKIDML